jgi:hypothetical protein
MGALFLLTACASSETQEGNVTIGTHTVAVTREGDLTAGDTTNFACKVDGGVQVDGVQAWYGLSSDTQRTACVYDSDDGDYDCDVSIAAPIPPGAALFIIVTTNGVPATGSIAVQ